MPRLAVPNSDSTKPRAAFEEACYVVVLSGETILHVTHRARILLKIKICEFVFII